MTFSLMPRESVLCLAIILTGAPVYIIFVKLKKPKPVQKKISKLYVFDWE